MVDRKIQFKNLFLVVLGAFVLAFGTYNFNYQNNITEGGVLGLLLFLKNMFNLPPHIMNLILDLSLFAIGMKFFGKKFLLYSITCTASFSLFYSLMEKSGPIIPNLSDNMLLASILAGLFVGFGVGLVVKGGGAAGGDDVIALVITKVTKITLNHVYLITDVAVLLISFIFLDNIQILWSLIAVYISGKVISIIYYDNDKHHTPDSM